MTLRAAISAMGLLLFLPLPALAAQSACEAILQRGIRDRLNTLDLDQQYRLAKATHCQSEASSSAQDAGIGVVEIFSGSYSDSQSSSREFCKTNEENYWKDRKFRSAVERINQGVVSAWESCIRSNTAGLSHYLEPTSDPNRFFYKVTFTPDGATSYTEVESFSVINATCDPQIAAGDRVDSGGTLTTCKRTNHQEIVQIAINATEGMKNVRGLELPVYRRVVVRETRCNTSASSIMGPGSPDRNTTADLEVCWPKAATSAKVRAFMRNRRSPSDPFKPCPDKKIARQTCQVDWSSATKLSSRDAGDRRCESWRFWNWLGKGATREAQLRVEDCKVVVRQ